MRHSRRTKLKVEDVDHALKVRNLEPLWGFASTSHLPFKKTVTPSGTIYHVEDEEIDLGKVLKTEMPSVPRDVSFTGEWDQERRRGRRGELMDCCSSLAGYRGDSASDQGEPFSSGCVSYPSASRPL